MIDMNDFRYFVTIVDKGGFTAGARFLGLPVSTMSHRMKQLERRLGLVLLHRSSRRFGMTQAGLEFYKHATDVVERAEEAEQAMRGRLTNPFGPIRYTTTTVTATFIMPRIVHSFMIKYPEIALFQHAVDHPVDIIGERFDLAIRAHTIPLPNSNLVQKTLARIPWTLFASPAYLDENGDPASPHDLAIHATLFTPRDGLPTRWTLSHKDMGRTEEVAISPRLSSTCIDSLRSAAKAGMGITTLPTCLCRDDVQSGELKPVLPGWYAPDTSLTALMPSRTGLGISVRAFLDHISGASWESFRAR